MAKLVFPRVGFWAVKQRGELVSTLRPADGQVAVAVRGSFSEGSFPLLLHHFLSLPPPLIPLEILSAGIFSLCHSYLWIVVIGLCSWGHLCISFLHPLDRSTREQLGQTFVCMSVNFPEHRKSSLSWAIIRRMLRDLTARRAKQGQQHCEPKWNVQPLGK